MISIRAVADQRDIKADGGALPVFMQGKRQAGGLQQARLLARCDRIGCLYQELRALTSTKRRRFGIGHHEIDFPGARAQALRQNTEPFVLQL